MLINGCRDSRFVTEDRCILDLFPFIVLLMKLIERIHENDVKVQHVNKVALGYKNLREEEIEEGVCRISTLLEVEIISFLLGVCTWIMGVG